MADKPDLQRRQPSDPSKPKQSENPNGEEPEVADFVGVFGETTFPIILISFGLLFAASTVGAELDQARGWAVPEFFGGLGFGALLVLLGSLERLVELRSPRMRGKQLPSATANPQGADTANQ